MMNSSIPRTNSGSVPSPGRRISCVCSNMSTGKLDRTRISQRWSIRRQWRWPAIPTAATRHWRQAAHRWTRTVLRLSVRPFKTSGESGAWLCDMLSPHIADMAALAGLGDVPTGLWPATADSRVDAVVSMAGDAFFFGQPGLSVIDIPVMAIGGTADEDSPYKWNTHPTYENVSSQKKVEIALNEAEHMIFTARCESTPLYMKTPIW